ncbi:hypothetical protein LUX57_48655 [Actinomadura madurae]|nr:hypothetical protein [Actinomadura madurae]MCP9971989.1 hypothetical protein [Actinomadura madurae]
MAGVVDERALARGGHLEPGEHVVEGAGETGDLVVAVRHRQPPLGLQGRDVGRLAGQRVHRPERGPDDGPGGEREQEDQQRRRDEQDELQPVAGRVHRSGRHTDHEHPVVRDEAPRQQPRGAAAGAGAERHRPGGRRGLAHAADLPRVEQPGPRSAAEPAIKRPSAE